VSETTSLALSVAGTATGLAVAVGLPLAWLLGRHHFPGRSLIQAAMLVPLVLPATLLGFWAVAVTRGGPVLPLLRRFGLSPASDWQLAVATAGLGALAVFVRFAQAGFARVDPTLEQAARTLGRSGWSVFWAVTLPLAWRGVVAGIALAFCRALGEFALIVLVARAQPPAAEVGGVVLYAVAATALLVLLTSKLTPPLR
jgi:molybdate transport system permease protein